MQCENKYVEQICRAYNKRHACTFGRKNAEQKYLNPWNLSLNHQPPPNYDSAYESLSRQKEFDIFTALHFIKYHINKSSSRQSPRYLANYIALRNKATTCNWPLVPMCVRVHVQYTPPGVDIDEFYDEGYSALISAVDHFDPWMGFRLSTYACSAIKKSFCRRKRKSVSLVPMCDEVYEQIGDPGLHSDNDELWSQQLKKKLRSNTLDSQEKRILSLRFGCFGYAKRSEKDKTLGEVGKIINLSKERVRQIQKQALIKLKRLLEQDSILKYC